MVLELRFWTDSRRADLLATTSVVRRRVVEAFSDARLPLPEPDLRRVELRSETPALSMLARAVTTAAALLICATTVSFVPSNE